jgi:hypothetical protein
MTDYDASVYLSKGENRVYFAKRLCRPNPDFLKLAE